MWTHVTIFDMLFFCLEVRVHSPVPIRVTCLCTANAVPMPDTGHSTLCADFRPSEEGENGERDKNGERHTLDLLMSQMVT